MIIYEKQPNDETLVRFGFEYCPSVGHIRLCRENGDVVDFAYRQLPGVVQPPDNERNDAMSFTSAYLWALLQARQNTWKAEHPNAEMIFA